MKTEATDGGQAGPSAGGRRALRRDGVLVLLAAWLAGSLGMWVVASANFATVDRVLAPGAHPELERRLAAGGPAEPRPILRFLASEMNRLFFRSWAVAQCALAVGLVLLSLEGGDGGRPVAPRLVLVIAVLTAVLAFVLTPLVRSLGAPLDFVPRPLPPHWQAHGRRFFWVHSAYMALDLVKTLLLGGGLWKALRPAGRGSGG